MHLLVYRTLLISIALFSVAFGSVQAENVIQSIEGQNIKAEASYTAGEANKPAILILHGFLSTNQFHTITSVSSVLQEEGYSTLAPTLTLNIPQRQSPIKCNSIHTHTMQSDALEIQTWVNWLKKQGHTKIVLLGHSSGSHSILEYLDTTKKDPAISLAVFTSLFYLKGEELGTKASDITAAKDSILMSRSRPNKYSFLFCQDNYYATPKSFLSYLKMDRQKTLDILNKLSIPSYTIMGSEDKRYKKVGTDWLEQIEQTPTNLLVIDGANHFFSGEYEFDFQDHIIDTLSKY